MGEISMCRIDTGPGLFFPKGSGINNFVSKLILFSNLLYDFHSFA